MSEVKMTDAEMAEWIDKEIGRAQKYRAMIRKLGYTSIPEIKAAYKARELAKWEARRAEAWQRFRYEPQAREQWACTHPRPR